MPRLSSSGRRFSILFPKFASKTEQFAAATAHPTQKLFSKSRFRLVFTSADWHDRAGVSVAGAGGAAGAAELKGAGKLRRFLYLLFLWIAAEPGEAVGRAAELEAACVGAGAYVSAVSAADFRLPNFL